MTRAIFVALGLLPVLSSPVAFGTAQDPHTDEADKKVVETVCGSCHDLQTVMARRRSSDDWRLVIEGMVSNGAVGTDEELAVVRSYLLRHVGLVNINTALADELRTVLRLSSEQAEAIVRYRTEHGEFVNLESVKKVPGLEAARVAEWEDRVVFK